MSQRVRKLSYGASYISRYSLAGILNTGVSLSVYWGLVYFDFPYYFASAGSIVTGIIFSFNTHRYYVFEGNGHFFNYILVWLFIYFVNVLMLGFLISYVNSYLAAVVLLPLNVFLGITLMQLYVFRTEE